MNTLRKSFVFLIRSDICLDLCLGFFLRIVPWHSSPSRPTICQKCFFETDSMGNKWYNLARCIDTYGSWTCQEMTELRTKASKKLGALKHIQRARLQRGRENDTKHQTTAGLAAQKRHKPAQYWDFLGLFQLYFQGMGIPTTYIWIFSGTRRLNLFYRVNSTGKGNGKPPSQEIVLLL